MAHNPDAAHKSTVTLAQTCVPIPAFGTCFAAYHYKHTGSLLELSVHSRQSARFVQARLCSTWSQCRAHVKSRRASAANTRKNSSSQHSQGEATCCLSHRCMQALQTMTKAFVADKPHKTRLHMTVWLRLPCPASPSGSAAAWLAAS